MRLHTNLTIKDLCQAVAQSGATVEKGTEHRSTVRTRAFEVTLSGDSSRWGNDGTFGAAGYKAASWDQWGIVLADLYTQDPAMIVGSPTRPIYAGLDHFHRVTVNRFNVVSGSVPVVSTGSPGYHANHVWNVQDACHPLHGYLIRTCTCGAQVDYGARV